MPATRLPRLFAIVLAVVCAGCAVNIGRAGHDAGHPSMNESYVVLGVEPEFTQVSLFRGSISDGVFHQNLILPASFAGQPEDGFVVTRSSAGEVLAITYVVMYSSKEDSFRPVLVPCAGAKTAVYAVPEGKVVYIGSVRYRQYGAGVVPQFGQDFEAAKAFMATHYPKLADRLEAARFDLMPATGQGGCAAR